MKTTSRIFWLGLLSFVFTNTPLTGQNSRPLVEIHVQNPANILRPNPACDQPSCISLLKAIESAQSTIDFAIYGIRGQSEILRALKQAQLRGVRVRGVVDSDVSGANYYRDTPELVSSIQSVRTDQSVDVASEESRTSTSQGAPRCARPEGTSGPLSCFRVTVGNRTYEAAQASEAAIEFAGDIMHNKFFVIDGNVVWTGSANLSDTDIGGYNANAVLLIHDGAIASFYAREFAQMYDEGRFHNQKVASPGKSVSRDGVVVTVLFSPQDDPVSEGVIPLIQAARERINISIFYLTNRVITEELIRSAARGVQIRVIVDATGAANEYSKHRLLREAGIQLKIENWGGKMHAKAASFDRRHLIAGSMNWTSAGDQRNDENTVIVRNAPALVSTYDAAFEDLWAGIPDAWLAGQPKPEGRESGTACTDGIDDDFDMLADAADPDCGADVRRRPSSDGACPIDAPLKGNASSMIFHVPSGQFYGRTRAEICFVDEEQAQAAGYRRSRS